jgi:chemotaxis protein MotB
MKKIILFASSIIIMSSCVSKKKLAEAQAEYSTFKAATENNLAKPELTFVIAIKQRAIWNQL